MALANRPYFAFGGSALVRRRIQTPFGAKVLSVVKSEGKVVLGASPPARRRRAGGRHSVHLRHRKRCRLRSGAVLRAGRDVGGQGWDQRVWADRAELLPREAGAGR